MSTATQKVTSDTGINVTVQTIVKTLLICITVYKIALIIATLPILQ